MAIRFKEPFQIPLSNAYEALSAEEESPPQAVQKTSYTIKELKKFRHSSSTQENTMQFLSQIPKEVRHYILSKRTCKKIAKHESERENSAN